LQITMFQCSSASRKFLNLLKDTGGGEYYVCFSALQRAENSSTLAQRRPQRTGCSVSVLFSEPKIPQPSTFTRSTSPRRGFSALQRAENSSTNASMRVSIAPNRVSVLFSEPKIPQPLAARR